MLPPRGGACRAARAYGRRHRLLPFRHHSAGWPGEGACSLGLVGTRGRSNPVPSRPLQSSTARGPTVGNRARLPWLDHSPLSSTPRVVERRRRVGRQRARSRGRVPRRPVRSAFKSPLRRWSTRSCLFISAPATMNMNWLHSSGRTSRPIGSLSRYSLMAAAIRGPAECRSAPGHAVDPDPPWRELGASERVNPRMAPLAARSGVPLPPEASSARSCVVPAPRSSTRQTPSSVGHPAEVPSTSPQAPCFDVRNRDPRCPSAAISLAYRPQDLARAAASRTASGRPRAQRQLGVVVREIHPRHAPARSARLQTTAPIAVPP